ncbi:zinc finger BED domain-containing protein RICESLEEPER 2-like protein [Tanacetum coccineum]
MPTVITCAAALNPCFNVFGVELLIESISTDLECFDDDFVTKAKERFIGYFQGLYNSYYLKYGNPTTQSTSAASSSTQSGGNTLTNLLIRLKDHSNKRARNDRSTSSEYERYLHSDFISSAASSSTQSGGFWKAKESMFPILSQMARDVLSVQATSVASKSTFTTSGRVLSIQRTRLTPEDILEEEVQDNEAIPLSDEEIALDEAASEAMSNGSGSGGEDVDLTLSESESPSD